jgi:formylglycine-generating enzyme required for sulfatase activity
VRKSLFVTVMITIACGMLWILFLAATRQSPVLDAADMVKVAGGVWTDPNQPGRTATVSPFLIDKYEVTNAQYARFQRDLQYPEYQEDFPVTGITWEEAAAYAKWAGKALPTEAEWALAAGAADQRQFPWGMEKRRLEGKSAKQLGRVGSYRDNVSAVGCYDMEGNAWEWTSDDPASATAASSCGEVLPQKILKGGWRQLKKSAAYAAINDRMVLEAQTRSPQVGFRCVQRMSK